MTANYDYKQLKEGGFMRQVQKDTFALRVKIIGGQIAADKLQKVYEIAQQYGQGYIHLTSRQAIEIPHIKLEDVEAAKTALAEAGLNPGACGPRVRTITACQGSTVCPSGLIDTTALAYELDEKYNMRQLPHKFKLGVTGCRNNCLKTEENDVGIKGGMMPEWQEAPCIYCGLCEAVCPTKAIKVDKASSKLTFNSEDCVYCGRCVKSCPTNAWEGKNGYLISFGGTFGNTIAPGKQVLPIVFSKEDVHKAIEFAMSFFNKHGRASERFRSTIDRVGWDTFQKELEEVFAHE